MTEYSPVEVYDRRLPRLLVVRMPVPSTCSTTGFAGIIRFGRTISGVSAPARLDVARNARDALYRLSRYLGLVVLHQRQ